jgi:precorrin-2 methylase
MLGVADNLVVLKVYRHFREILEVIREEDLLDKSVAVRKCGLPGESISRDIETWEGDVPSYFTLLLVKVHRAPHLLCCRALEVQGVRLRARTPRICSTL